MDSHGFVSIEEVCRVSGIPAPLVLDAALFSWSDRHGWRFELTTEEREGQPKHLPSLFIRATYRHSIEIAG
jgi:hypothetical protein